MKRYERYKPSGIQWIGEIPDHWTLATVGRVSNLGRGRVISSIEIGENPGEFPVYSSQTENNGVMGYLNSFNFKGEYVTWTTDGANAGTVFFRKGKFNCTNVCGTIQPKNWEQIDLRFIPYFLNLGTKYSVRLDINPKLMNNMMAKIPIVIPPKEEQTAIANYLNYKTAQIDDLIAKKYRFIDLLNEEKTAIINQAVTKGLDPNTPMKDSGIHWLEEIPANWEVKKLKYLAWAINEKTEYDIEFKISLENIESKTGRLISLENENNFQGELRKFQKGDVLFNKLRPYLAKAYLADKNGGCLGELLIFRSKGELIPTFLFYRVLSYDFIKIVDSSTYGSKMPRASWDDFISQLLIPYPQNDEQTAIANYLDRKTDQMDDVISKTHHEIELLQEYRTVLISEAVTGKIDVRI